LEEAEEENCFSQSETTQWRRNFLRSNCPYA